MSENNKFRDSEKKKFYPEVEFSDSMFSIFVRNNVDVDWAKDQVYGEGWKSSSIPSRIPNIPTLEVLLGLK